MPRSNKKRIRRRFARFFAESLLREELQRRGSDRQTTLSLCEELIDIRPGAGDDPALEKLLARLLHVLRSTAYSPAPDGIVPPPLVELREFLAVHVDSMAFDPSGGEPFSTWFVAHVITPVASPMSTYQRPMEDWDEDDLILGISHIGPTTGHPPTRTPAPRLTRRRTTTSQASPGATTSRTASASAPAPEATGTGGPSPATRLTAAPGNNTCETQQPPDLK